MNYRLIDSVEVTEEKIHIIHLKSVFDASTVDEFEQVLQYLIAKKFCRFVIDLAKVEFISSAGWGNFVGELQNIRNNKGDLKLAGMSEDVYDVFLLLELDLFIKAYATVDEALVDFSKNIIGVKEKKPAKPSLFTGKKKSAAAAKPASEQPSIPAELQVDESLQSAGDFSEGSTEQVTSKIIDPWFEGEGELELSVNLDPPKPKKQVDVTPSQQQRAQAPEKAEPPQTRQPVPDDWQQRPPRPAQESSPHSTEDTSQFEQPQPSARRDFEDTREAQQQKSGNRNYRNGLQREPENGFNRSADYLNYSKIRPTDLSSDPMLEKIVSVVIANPAYGPSAIRQMLIRLSMADESLTRSDIYRKLEEYDLSTRAKRIAFARANSL